MHQKCKPGDGDELHRMGKIECREIRQKGSPVMMKARVMKCQKEEKVRMSGLAPMSSVEKQRGSLDTPRSQSWGRRSTM